MGEQFPALRKVFPNAALVPERHARALGVIGPDDSYLDHLPELRKRLVAAFRQIGTLQTGADVDLRWVRNAAEVTAQAVLGVARFDFATEDVPEALLAVVTAAEAQLTQDGLEARSAAASRF